MIETRQILFFVYDGFETLDMAGPASVFNAVNTVLGKEAYRSRFVSAEGGMVRGNTGMSVETASINRIRSDERATLIVAGAEAAQLQKAISDKKILCALRKAWPKVGRIASVCSGSFLLAETGALDGCKATTHWEGRRAMAKTYPNVKVEDDALYVVDGDRWTSAGVATGIDMALAMARREHGAEVMRAAAKRLVVYAHRPGNQSQFSSIVEAQTRGGDEFSDLIAWMDAHAHDGITVPDLAARTNMSERTFHRKFVKAVGETPARFLENLRLEKARAALDGGAPAKEAAQKAGFQSVGGFRAAFESKFGVTPATYRKMHAAA